MAHGAVNLPSLPLPAMLEDLARLLAGHSTAGRHTTREVLARAEASVASLVTAASDGLAERLAVEAYAASAVAGLVVREGRADAVADPAGLLAAVERLTGVPAAAIALRVLGDVSLLSLPLPTAIETGTALLRSLAPMREVTILPPGVHVPEFEVAEISRWHRPCALLAWIPQAGAEAACRAFAERFAQLLGPAYERASLLEGNAERTRARDETAERRLTRLGFDLHDGALQDISLLSGELDGLRRALPGALADSPEREAILRRFDDILAIVSFLDDDLRGLASTMDLPGMLKRPFRESLDSVVRTFAARTDIEPEVVVTGDTSTISDSQRIALLRIVQESLSNVREHSQASQVKISVAAHSTHMEAEISDDGAGFDVEEALRRAARSGRMGLLGMTERVRLLGGTCDISSSPDQGTTIALTVARWIPHAGEPGLAATAA